MRRRATRCLARCVRACFIAFVTLSALSLHSFFVGIPRGTISNGGTETDVRSSPPSTIKPSAWLIGCLKEDPNNAEAMENCLVAVCSLLNTTAPENVVVMVDVLAKQDIGGLLEAQGVQLFVAPDIDTSRIQRLNFPVQKRKRAIPMQVYAAKKYFAWTLTQFSKVLSVDGTDVIFVRNASRMMTEYQPFASIADFDPVKSKRCIDGPDGYRYLNAGVILLEPSMDTFNVLMETYFLGNFSYCPSGSSVMYGNQEVISTFAFQIPGLDGVRPPPMLGEFHAWPFCFNYRGWHDQNHCKNSSDLMLLHVASDQWPTGQKKKYLNLAHRGKCKSSLSLASSH